MPHRKPTDIDKSFGRQIAALRRDAKKSQSEVAEHIGVTYQQIGKYESGKSRMSLGLYEEIRSFLAGTPSGMEEQQSGYVAPVAVNPLLVESLKAIEAEFDALRRKLNRAIRDAGIS
jgi:transcriptional regulator with XRE-family HTH domain